MNHDDHEKENPDLHPFIEPGLEARVVACVLGEASAFENAELERLCAEQPELAIFKRRIQAVHGLATKAARPEMQPLRLAPERRQKILQVISAQQENESSTKADSGQRRVVHVLNPQRPRQRRWFGGLVAGLAMGGILAVLVVPGARLLEDTFAPKPLRPNPSQTMIAGKNGDDATTQGMYYSEDSLMAMPQSGWDPAISAAQRLSGDDGVSLSSRGGGDYNQYRSVITDRERRKQETLASEEDNRRAERASREAPSVEGRSLADPLPTFLSASPPTTRPAPLIAATPAPRASPAPAPAASQMGVFRNAGGSAIFGDEETMSLSPFVVEADANVGYTAANTLAGSRLNTKLRDIGSAITVVTSDFLKEAGATDNDKLLQYTTSTEVAGLPRNFTWGQGVDVASVAPLDMVTPWQDLPGNRSDIRGPNSSLFGVGAPAEITNTPKGSALALTFVSNDQRAATGAVGGATAGAVIGNNTGSGNAATDTNKFKSEPLRIRGLSVADNTRDILMPDLLWEGYNVTLNETFFEGLDGSRAQAEEEKDKTDASALQAALIRKTQLDLAQSRIATSQQEISQLETEMAELRKDGGKASARSATIEHDVAPGETLAAISRRYGVTVADLMQLNGVTDPRRLQVGQKLRIPKQNPLPAPPSTAPKPGAATPDEVSTAVEPVSTFSLHVSDVSFRIAQAALARGEAPDPSRIRPEEFYNAFDYGDPAPAAAEKIACRIEQAAHPVLQQRNLVRIAVRVPATGRGAGQPLRLTVLLDTSGSMERADRAASVRRAMEVLGSLLGPNDRVTVIGFARTPRLLVEALPGDQAAARLAELVAQTPAEGGTNLESALGLALVKAQQYFDAAAQNRIVLITDGAANLGNANPEHLASAIKTARERGLAFDACGVGTDGLDDAILEALTRQGDGRYYVLDSPEDADAGFARQLAGAFRPAAQNVKLQVRFNPARVAHYRLIGFEQHRLREEDFRNDKVDAAELAAEEAAVAVYQVAVLPEGEGELGDVFVRFRDTASNEMVERSWTMPFEARARAFDQATPTLQLAGVAALLAEKLRGGAMADLVRFDELAPVVNALRGRYASNARVQELVTMVEQARRMSGEW